MRNGMKSGLTLRLAALLPALGLALAATLAACDDRVAATAFRSLPPEGWHSADTLVFPADSLAAGSAYAVVLSLRLSAAHPYPFRSVTLTAARCFPADSLTDTLTLPLVEGRSDMSGKGTTLYQYDFTIDTLLTDTATRGCYVVRHLMRRDPLPGIHDVGITLRRLDAPAAVAP